jgi:hypothetical protein
LACRDHTYQGDDAGLVAFVPSRNLHRRRMDESQRAMTAANIANLSVGRRWPVIVPTGTINISAKEAAEMLQVGERTVKRARGVQQRAVPELVEAVETREVSLRAVGQAADRGRIDAAKRRSAATTPS